jgi:hypothetical protein
VPHGIDDGVGPRADVERVGVHVFSCYLWLSMSI